MKRSKQSDSYNFTVVISFISFFFFFYSSRNSSQFSSTNKSSSTMGKAIPAIGTVLSLAVLSTLIGGEGPSLYCRDNEKPSQLVVPSSAADVLLLFNDADKRQPEQKKLFLDLVCSFHADAFASIGRPTGIRFSIGRYDNKNKVIVETPFSQISNREQLLKKIEERTRHQGPPVAKSDGKTKTEYNLCVAVSSLKDKGATDQLQLRPFVQLVVVAVITRSSLLESNCQRQLENRPKNVDDTFSFKPIWADNMNGTYAEAKVTMSKFARGMVDADIVTSSQVNPLASIRAKREAGSGVTATKKNETGRKVDTTSTEGDMTTAKSQETTETSTTKAETKPTNEPQTAVEVTTAAEHEDEGFFKKWGLYLIIGGATLLVLLLLCCGVCCVVRRRRGKKGKDAEETGTCKRVEGPIAQQKEPQKKPVVVGCKGPKAADESEPKLKAAPPPVKKPPKKAVAQPSVQPLASAKAPPPKMVRPPVVGAAPPHPLQSIPRKLEEKSKSASISQKKSSVYATEAETQLSIVPSSLKDGVDKKQEIQGPFDVLQSEGEGSSPEEGSKDKVSSLASPKKPVVDESMSHSLTEIVVSEPVDEQQQKSVSSTSYTGAPALPSTSSTSQAARPTSPSASNRPML